MRPTPAQAASKSRPDLYNLACRILAPDFHDAFGGVWRPTGCKLVDIALLWQHMGDEFTAKEIFDFYKALPLYSLKRVRTSKEGCSKRQRRSHLEKESYAALNRLTLEAAMTICCRFGVDPENLPQGKDIKILHKHIRACMLHSETGWITHALSTASDGQVQIPKKRLWIFKPQKV